MSIAKLTSPFSSNMSLAGLDVHHDPPRNPCWHYTF